MVKYPIKPPNPVFRADAPFAKHCSICLPVGQFEWGRRTLRNIAPNKSIQSCQISTPASTIWTHHHYGPALEVQDVDNYGVRLGKQNEVLEDPAESSFVIIASQTGVPSGANHVLLDQNWYQAIINMRFYWTTTSPYFRYGSNTGYLSTTTSSPYVPGIFNSHIFICTAGLRGVELWADGVLIANQTGTYNTPGLNSGSYFHWGGLIQKTPLAYYSYFARYKRELSVQAINDIFSDPWCMIRPPKLYIEPLGFVSGGLALVKILSETEDLDETLLHRKAMSRFIDDEESIDEGTLRAMALRRIIEEIEDINETTPRLLSIVRIISEEEDLNETTIAIRGLIRIIDDEEDIDESTLKVSGFVRVVDETEDIDESTVRLRGIVKLVNDEESIDEFNLRTRSLARIIDEEEDVQESILRPRAMFRVIDEDAEIAESLLTPRQLRRIIDEIEDLSETIDGQVTHAIIKVISESEDIGEVVVHVTLAAGDQIFEEYTIILKDTSKNILLKDTNKNITLFDTVQNITLADGSEDVEL